MSKKTKVLVVDDDRRMARTICDILRVKGYEAIEANDGIEAVEKVKSDTPDCVLMDIKMPKLSGVEALKTLYGLAPKLPVILMIAHTTDEQILEAKQHGAYAVLNKPIDIQAFLLFLSAVRKERSILIVDDDAVFCRTLKDILQSRGYKVETEIDPDNVITDMEHEYKLVVLLDLKLGKKNGTDVLRDVRAKYPTKPVILITGYGEEMANSIKKGLQIGAHAYLYKPFEIDELIRYIDEIDRGKLEVLLEKK